MLPKSAHVFAQRAFSRGEDVCPPVETFLRRSKANDSARARSFYLHILARYSHPPTLLELDKPSTLKSRCPSPTLESRHVSSILESMYFAGAGGVPFSITPSLFFPIIVLAVIGRPAVKRCDLQHSTVYSKRVFGARRLLNVWELSSAK